MLFLISLKFNNISDSGNIIEVSAASIKLKWSNLLNGISVLLQTFEMKYTRGRVGSVTVHKSAKNKLYEWHFNDCRSISKWWSYSILKQHQHLCMLETEKVFYSLVTHNLYYYKHLIIKVTLEILDKYQ